MVKEKTKMKKILSLVMALAMVLGCFAMAETTSILDADMDELLVLDRESSLNDWEGEWVLVAAYITADFAEEYDVEQSGLLAVPENAGTLTITALKDATRYWARWWTWRPTSTTTPTTCPAS